MKARKRITPGTKNRLTYADGQLTTSSHQQTRKERRRARKTDDIEKLSSEIHIIFSLDTRAAKRYTGEQLVAFHVNKHEKIMTESKKER